MSEEEKDGFAMPGSELEFKSLTTVPRWNDLLNNPYFLSKLSDTKPVFIPKGTKITINGEVITTEEDINYYNQNNALSVVGMITQDLRLSNLQRSDLLFVEKNLRLASHCIRNDLRPASIFLIDAILRLELTQSLKGFLRTNERTINQKQDRTFKEEKPKTFFWNKPK